MAIIKFTDLQQEIGVGYLNTICKQLNIPTQDMDDAKEPEKGWLSQIRAVAKEMKRLKTTSVVKAIRSLSANREAKEDDKSYNQITTDVNTLIEQKNQRELDEMQQIAIARGEQKAASIEVVENMTALHVYATGDYQDPNLATAVQASKDLLFTGILGGVDGYRSSNFLGKFRETYGIGSSPKMKQISNTSTPQ
ncbi:hypothetical protein NDA01_21635 [Trichocoleus desertorum AS-A10]|uniref:hypothetical protein n=1 Tax=Trichocoleus desertorum TaxID=1481672 RepID=UPI0032973407